MASVDDPAKHPEAHRGRHHHPGRAGQTRRRPTMALALIAPVIWAVVVSLLVIVGGTSLQHAADRQS
jgi:hypothetical protein